MKHYSGKNSWTAKLNYHWTGSKDNEDKWIGQNKIQKIEQINIDLRGRSVEKKKLTKENW